MQTISSICSLQSVWLNVLCPKTASLFWNSEKLHRAAEKSLVEGDGRDVETQNSETYFYSILQSQTHYRKSEAQSPHFSVQDTRLLWMKRFAGTNELSVDTPYPKIGNSACSQFRKVENGTLQRRTCLEDILHHFVVLDGNVEQKNFVLVSSVGSEIVLIPFFVFPPTFPYCKQHFSFLRSSLP